MGEIKKLLHGCGEVQEDKQIICGYTYGNKVKYCDKCKKKIESLRIK